MKDLIIKEVGFHSVKMVACKDLDGEIHVSIRSICDGLGVDYQSQLKRIKRDDILPEGVVKMTIPTNGGMQKVNMMNIEYLPFFLVGIKSSMCREEIKPKLKDFKLKAKDVLANAFIKNRNKKDEKYLIQREAGKIVRNMLTDTIKESVPDSPNKHFMYPNYTRLIYKILFNKSTAELRAEKGLSKKDNLREHFNAEELKEIQMLENTVSGLINLGMGYHEIKDMLNQRYLKQIS